MAVENRLSARQEQWFAAIRAGLEAETGTPLAEWIEIAKSCPETAHRARLAWFKTHHNLLQNRASYVLSAAFPPAMGWNDPDRLRDQLWSDPAARAIYDAIAAAVEALPEIVAGPLATAYVIAPVESEVALTVNGPLVFDLDGTTVNFSVGTPAATVKLVVAVAALYPVIAGWLALNTTVPTPVSVTTSPEIVAGPLVTA